MTIYPIVSKIPGPGTLKERQTLGTRIDVFAAANRIFSASEGRTLGLLFRTSFCDIRTTLVGPNWWRIGDLSRRDIIVSCEAVSMLKPGIVGVEYVMVTWM